MRLDTLSRDRSMLYEFLLQQSDYTYPDLDPVLDLDRDLADRIHRPTFLPHRLAATSADPDFPWTTRQQDRISFLFRSKLKEVSK
jgi:hypothetical protein